MCRTRGTFLQLSGPLSPPPPPPPPPPNKRPATERPPAMNHSVHLPRVALVVIRRAAHTAAKVHQQVAPPVLQSQRPHRPQTFSDLSLHPSLVSALTATNKTRPTDIQARAIPHVLAGRHTLIAAETGSGKTLAYLAPLLSALKTREAAERLSRTSSADAWGSATYEDSDESLSLRMRPSRSRPSVLVLQPTRELVEQAARVAKQLGHISKVRVRAAAGGALRSVREKSLGCGGADVVVATPGALVRLRERRLLSLANVRAVVLDEADELLEAGKRDRDDKRRRTQRDGMVEDGARQPRPARRRATGEGGGDALNAGRVASFADQLREVVKAATESGAQFVYVAATLPKRLERFALESHESSGALCVVKGERLHVATSQAQVKTTFVRIDGADGTFGVKLDKVVEIVTSARARGQSAGKMLVFCDGAERRETVLERLVCAGVRPVLLGGSEVRTPGEDGEERVSRDDAWKAFRDGEARVAVCARSFARGIDDSEIRTVVLMDVPVTGGEYVHRVGRIRQSGRVYVLVGPREEVRAEALFVAHVKGERVAGVDARVAWKERTEAGFDRIEGDKRVKEARRSERARWVDERASRVGTFRGRTGRKTALADRGGGDGAIRRLTRRRATSQ